MQELRKTIYEESAIAKTIKLELLDKEYLAAERKLEEHKLAKEVYDNASQGKEFYIKHRVYLDRISDLNSKLGRPHNMNNLLELLS